MRGPPAHPLAGGAGPRRDSRPEPRVFPADTQLTYSGPTHSWRMTLIIAIVATVLLAFQVALLARAALDWSVVFAGPAARTSIRGRLSAGVRAVTEPVLAPVRRVLPPLRL